MTKTPEAEAAPVIGLLAVNAASFFSQSVQIGALPALLGLALAERGVDPFAIGLVSAGPWAAILLLSRIVPRFLARVGLLTGVAVSVAISAAAVALMTVAEHPAAFFALNFCLGVGLIIRWVACDTWIVALAPKELRGRAIGAHETVMGLGIAAGPLVLSLVGVSGSAPFVACVGLLLATLPCLLLVRRFDLRAGPDQEHDPLSLRGVFALMPIGLLGAFVAGFVETSIVSLFAVGAAAAGVGAVAATLLLTASGMGATLLQIPIGWFADRRGGRDGQILCAAAILAGAVALPAALGQLQLAAVLIFVWGGAVGGMNTLAVMEAGEKIGDRHMSSAMTAVAFFYTAGSMLGPTLSGAAMERVSPYGMMMVAGVAAAAFLAATAGRRPQARAANET